MNHFEGRYEYYDSISCCEEHKLHGHVQSPSAEPGTVPKGKGPAVADAQSSGKVGLHPARAGLINREQIDAIRQAVHELEQAGYIVRARERDSRGRLRGAEYTIYEEPQLASDLPALEKPLSENPMLENPTLDNPTQ